MAFMQITAPPGSRNEPVLTAVKARPTHAEVMAIIRGAAPALGLKPPVLATLEALLSCLPRERNHDVVFASNATIAMRRNGISDRTLRRHAAELIDLGLIERRDSPNGKRFAKRDQDLGLVLRFGFDLTPLFLSIGRLKSLAESCQEEERRISYLRMKLRIAIMKSIELGAPEPLITAARTALRRKLTAVKLEDWISRLAPVDHLETAEEHPRYASSSQDERPVSTSQNPFQNEHRNQNKAVHIPLAARADSPSAPLAGAQCASLNPRDERDLREKRELLLALQRSYALLEKPDSRPAETPPADPEAATAQAPHLPIEMSTGAADPGHPTRPSQSEDSPSFFSRTFCSSLQDERLTPDNQSSDCRPDGSRDASQHPSLTAVKPARSAPPVHAKPAHASCGPVRASILSATDGHSVRHHQSPDIDNSKEVCRGSGKRAGADRELTIDRILTNCKAAASFLVERPRRPEDIITHARNLAPMMGIEGAAYDAAERSRGRFAAALTVWFLAEIQDRIERTGAYFRSITSGARAQNFCPVDAILGLGSGTGELSF